MHENAGKSRMRASGIYVGSIQGAKITTGGLWQLRDNAMISRSALTECLLFWRVVKGGGNGICESLYYITLDISGPRKCGRKTVNMSLSSGF